MRFEGQGRRWSGLSPRGVRVLPSGVYLMRHHHNETILGFPIVRISFIPHKVPGQTLYLNATFGL